MIKYLRKAAIPALALTLLAVVGCSDGRTRPPPVDVTVIHAAGRTGELVFLRGERPEANLGHLVASTNLIFDADTYRFAARTNDTLIGAPAAIELAAFSAEMQPEHSYVIVLTQSGDDDVVPLVIEKPAFTDSAGTQLSFTHAHPTAPPVDVYMESPGTDPAAAAPIGTVAYGESIPALVMPSGDYQLTLIEAGNPANVLLSSSATALDDGDRRALVLAGGTEGLLEPYMVIATSRDGFTHLYDEAVQGGLEVINAAADGTARDVYVNDDFTAPVFSAVPSLGFSEVVPIPSGSENSVSVTLAGSDIVETGFGYVAPRGRFSTQLIAGKPGELRTFVRPNDARRVKGEARIRFMNGTSTIPSLVVFLLAADVDSVLIDPQNTTLLTAQISNRFSLMAGEYRLVMYNGNASEPMYGPVPLILGEGLYTVLARDAATPETVENLFLEDFE